MANWHLTNGRTIDGWALYDLHRDGTPVLTGVGYNIARQTVYANGADADTYIEDHMSAPQTIAELHADDAEMERALSERQASA